MDSRVFIAGSSLSAFSLSNRWASSFLQDTRLMIPFDQTLPDHVYKAMYMDEARLAMGELVRYLDEVEKIAKRTRG